MKNNITKLILDIGNSKVKFLLGELNSEGDKLRVIEYVERPSRGIKKSVIENPEVLSEIIRDAVIDLKAKTGLEIEKASIGTSGNNIRSRTKNIKIFFNEKDIEQSDLEKLFLKAEEELFLRGERVIEREIYNIRVNNSGIIKNPVGITGSELQADVHLITLDEAEVEMVSEVVNRAGLVVENILLNASASAKATLDEEDRQMGVALIDIGEGSTDIIIFKNDKMIYSKSLPLGGMHYVNDISYLFQINRGEAGAVLEKLRKKEIHNDYILIGDTKKVSIEDIKNIIDARTGDLISFITQTIEESGFNGYLGKGLVLTGGAVVIDDLFNKVHNKTGYAVRRVNPLQLRGLEDVEPGMSTPIGMFLKVMEEEYNRLKEEEKINQRKMNEKEIIGLPNSFGDEFEENSSESVSKFKMNFGALEAIKKWISNFI
ncbi:MAG: cell division protein FtsA [Cetobacterium sp.]|uniref:cell division protein FtsA n=1 Tax=Cetobacterium sp. TaxID=2071632 RepID=UPI002FC66EE1